MPCHPNGSCVARIKTQEVAQTVPQFIKREKIKIKKIEKLRSLEATRMDCRSLKGEATNGVYSFSPIRTGGSATKTPEWAVAIVQEVCGANGRPIPTIIWLRNRRGSWTEGRRQTYPSNGTVIVSVGTDGLEKQVLLHELTHHIHNSGLHDRRFYTILRGLLIRYDCYTQEYKKFEGE
jgi:hypothetical protein